MSSPRILRSVIPALYRLGLNEADVLDAYHTGEYRKMRTGEAIIKKYSGYGYELVIYFRLDKYNSGYVITGVLKNPAR